MKIATFVENSLNVKKMEVRIGMDNRLNGQIKLYANKLEDYKHYFNRLEVRRLNTKSPDQIECLTVNIKEVKYKIKSTESFLKSLHFIKGD